MGSFSFANLLNSYVDKKSKFLIEKQAINDLIWNSYGNKFSGKVYFDAIVLSGAPTSGQELKEGDVDRHVALKVRPVDIHNFVLPDPCKADCVSEKSRLLALHPTAYQLIDNVSSTNAMPPFGSIVECYFRGGNVSSGLLRGLQWRVKTVGQAGLYNFECEDLISLTSDFTYNQLLGDSSTLLDFPSPAYKGKEYNSAVEFMHMLKSGGLFGTSSDAFYAALTANAEAESNLGKTKHDSKLDWVVGDKVSVSSTPEVKERSINWWCSHGYWQMNVCPEDAEGSLFAKAIGANMTDETGQKKFVKAVNNHGQLFPWLSTRLNGISAIRRLRAATIKPHKDTAKYADLLGHAICLHWEKPKDADASATKRGKRAAEIHAEYRASPSPSVPEE